MHWVTRSFPSINRDGGFAEFLLTSDAIGGQARAVAASASIAALADAGLSATTDEKAIPALGPGTRALVIGGRRLGPCPHRSAWR
jgi:NAD+-dependent secondary alcohol dehydrogenase Adh1